MLTDSVKQWPWLATRRPPEPAAARILADAIRPRENDSDKPRTLRKLVFRWVWNAAQHADR